MEIFDSASLRYGDCFAVPFGEPGRHRYAIVPAHGYHLTFEHPFEIEVSECAKDESPAQLDIVVGFRDGRLTATPAKASISPGMAICWNPEDADVPGFMVAAEDGSFASDPLSGPSIFSHRFRHEGVYAWMDRHGGTLSGRISVTAPNGCDKGQLGKWHRQVQEAVMIPVPQAAKSDYRALVGQPVVFVIDDVTGISITDERWAQTDPCRRAPAAPAKAGAAGTRKS